MAHEETTLLNLAVGSHKDIDGKSCILTREGASGHAVYGPYQHLEAGRYAVEFNLSTAENSLIDGSDVCAAVDVVSDFGRRTFAAEQVPFSRLRHGPLCIRLAFDNDAPGLFEFRVAITGRVPLLIEDYCRVVPLDETDANYTSVMTATAFPDASILPKPAFFLHNAANLRRLYESGATVKISGDDTIVVINDISFYARTPDDLRFVDEIFFRSAYNFSFDGECCVIDIGMNIGLVSLTFANKSTVKEVHSFEPFRGTYLRACDNLRLNADIAEKITSYNFGLSDTDKEATVLIYDESDSGAFSIRGSTQGTPEQISIKDAATALRPIIETAASAGRRVIAKVDCEGSEFPIFRTLEASGLLAEISAFMVEWHRGVDGQTQHDLIKPLLRHGFVIFDQTGKTGNGFFYAVRSSSGNLPAVAAEQQADPGSDANKIAELERHVQTLSDRQAAEFDKLRSMLGLIDFDQPGAVARQIAEKVGFKGIQANGLYRAFTGSEDPICTVPQPLGFTSSLCHQSHFGFDQYRFWVRALKDKPLFYRKQWEFVYIAQVLFERGYLKGGNRGIVFGAGQEPLPALFASFGVATLATDQAPEAAVGGGWSDSSQHTYDVSALNQRGICTDRMFQELVSFMNVDMNDIPASLSGEFDFCWSACSLEHLGSLQHGFDFIENAMRTLKPGGIAIHTTEFNLSSNEDTYESVNLSIYRKRDIERFIADMTAKGFVVAPIDWTVGEGFAETVIDLPPYGRGEPHIRLSYGGYDVTSIGLIIEKPLTL